eukprot:480048-Pleurochrysis_carterae.AAC.2
MPKTTRCTRQPMCRCSELVPARAVNRRGGGCACVVAVAFALALEVVRAVANTTSNTRRNTVYVRHNHCGVRTTNHINNTSLRLCAPGFVQLLNVDSLCTARAGTGSGYLKIVWPASDAITRSSALLYAISRN